MNAGGERKPESSQSPRDAADTVTFVVAGQTPGVVPAGTSISALCSPVRLGCAWALAILLYSMTLLLAGLGESRVLTRHEVLAAQPAREMLSDGHWLIPTIAGEPRTNKPPTTGWLIAASMSVFGSDAEWVARLPVALTGVLTSLMVAVLGTRLLAQPAGVLAGFLQSSFYYVLLQARLAEADMPMTAAVVGAMMCLAIPIVCATPGQSAFGRTQSDRRLHWGWSVGFWACNGLAMLLKGPVGVAFVLLATIAYGIWSRDSRVRRLLLHPSGLASFAVLGLGWPVAAYLSYPPIADVWYREIFQRVSGDMGPGKIDPIWTYLADIPVLLLPWLPFVVIGVWQGYRRRMLGKPAGRFLACWLVPGLILLHLSVNRHKHYAIPLLPPLTLAAAGGMLLVLRGVSESTAAHLRRASVILGALGIAGAAAAWVGVSRDEGRIGSVLAVLLAGLGSGLSLKWLATKRPTAAASMMFFTLWAVAIVVFTQVMPRTDGQYRSLAELAGRVNRLTQSQGPPIYLVELGETHVSYYLNPPMKRIDDREAFVASLQSVAGPIYALMPLSTFEALGDRAQEIDRAEKFRERDGAGSRVVLARVSPKL